MWAIKSTTQESKYTWSSYSVVEKDWFINHCQDYKVSVSCLSCCRWPPDHRPECTFCCWNKLFGNHCQDYGMSCLSCFRWPLIIDRSAHFVVEINCLRIIVRIIAWVVFLALGGPWSLTGVHKPPPSWGTETPITWTP